MLRFILTNPQKKEISPTGILLSGAYISGQLDLSYVKALPNIHFFGCRFENGIEATKTSWTDDLQLTRCKIPFIEASGIEVSGQINLEGSFFGYQAQTQQGSNETPKKPGSKFTLNLQDARIGNSLLLPSAAVFGGLRVANAKISGQLNCEGATLTTSPPFYKEERSRSDQKQRNYALDLQETEIGSGFLFCSVVTCEDAVNFVRASVDSFLDEGTTWRVHKDTSFDGFTYNHLHNKLDLKERLNWLSVGDTFKGQFYPQPYKQLAKVLHDMGHEHDAREVSYALAERLETKRLEQKQQEQRTTIENGPQPGKLIGLFLCLCYLRARKFLLWIVVGYGWKPNRSLLLLAALIFSFWVLTFGAWHFGDFAPNSAIILLSEDWLCLSHERNAAKLWTDTDAGKDWETFHSLAYAADVVIPIIEFGQTDAWAPSSARGAWGTLLWWLRWPFTLAGWLVTALGAAALTGVIRRE